MPLEHAHFSREHVSTSCPSPSAWEAVYHFFREHVGTSYHYGQLQTGAGRRHFNSVHTSTGTGHAPGGARHLHDEYTVPLWKRWA
eukprot:7676283-Pyramimonas_sp.AAC.1